MLRHHAETTIPADTSTAAAGITIHAAVSRLAGRSTKYGTGPTPRA
ncbi:MAG: hypothetical protein R2705_18630 [Ilumatobacteraceae bacterium]